MLAAVAVTAISSTAVAAGSVPGLKIYDFAGRVPGYGCPTGYVRDAAGTAQVVYVAKNGLHYLTRATGATKWTSRVVPGSDRQGLGAARLVLSLDGRHEFLVASAGRELYVMEKRTSAPNFPSMTAATSVSRYSGGSPPGSFDGERGRFPGVAALPHGQIAISVVANRGNNITRDPKMGFLVVVGDNENPANDDRTSFVAWVLPGGRGTWTGPQTIAATYCEPTQGLPAEQEGRWGCS